MSQNKWQLNRAGLFNFWYYDDEEFSFADGKLLLRGSNGSGKSVTMQSLIPVLLDGRKSPDRLDPFGSRARRMEDYLLGEKDVVDRDERTGYLYLEYRRRQTKQYLTTGIGLRAKRNSSLEFWGFVILDNRRIGRDFFLYKTEYNAEGKKEKIPLTRRELEHRLETGGRVVRTQGEYMELVNKYIFGFPSLEAYKELVDLLIQLRSPKLSKDFKPTVVYEILDKSLPPLTDEELRPLSDTIENMDQIKQQLEQLERERNSLQRLCSHYDLYNRYLLAERAQGVLTAEDRCRNLNKRKEQHLQDREQYRRAGEEAAREMEGLRREQEVLTAEVKKLEDHDVFRAEEEKQDLLALLAQTRQDKGQKEEALEQKQNREWELQKAIHGAEVRLTQQEKVLRELLKDLEGEAEEAGFTNHWQAARDFQGNFEKGFAFDLWQKETGDYRQKLRQILKTLREYVEARRHFQEADQELAEVKRVLDEKRLEEKREQERYEAEKQHLLEAVYSWLEKNSELNLEPEEIRLLVRNLQELYEPLTFEEARKPVENAFRRQQNILERELVYQKHCLEEKQGQIKAKGEELAHWRSVREPEPERHPETESARKALQEKGIPYLPFFAAVEFKTGVSPQERERIEAASKEMGLLDALIVPADKVHLVGKADKVIIPCPQELGYTLADYLYPTPVDGIGVSAADIDKVLRSIVLATGSGGQTGMLEDGSYRIGLLQGQAPSQERAIYIGREARLRHRRQVISRLEGELAALERELQELEIKKGQVEQRCEELRREYGSLPAPDTVRNSFTILEKRRHEVKIMEDEVRRKNEKVKELLAKMLLMKDKVRELEGETTLEPRVEVYEEAISRMESYANYLHQLQLEYEKYKGVGDKLVHYRDNLAEVAADVDNLKGELNRLAADADKLGQQLEQVEKRLQELGAAQLRQRIEGIMERLREIERNLQELPRVIAQSEARVEIAGKELARTEEDLQLAERVAVTWQKLFAQEERLGFVIETELPVSASREDILHRARTVAAELAPVLTENDRERVKDRLNRSYYEEQALLVEYRLSLEELPGPQTPGESDEDGAGTYYLEELKQKSGRIQLLLEYNGKRVSPYYVLQQMEGDIELQKLTLSERDRQLYEEIIMNNVGRVIRERIGRAEEWVDKIDNLMRQRDTSSGLTFSLRWRPLLAEHEEELDTGQLVDLLRSDPRLLKEEDINRITRHFQIRIDRAKELLADKGPGETLHQVIKEVLDYRRWFSFTLYYRREGEARKELTNNAFYQFSGGEKAMAMYIPLFSAVYSRYLEARDDAPRVISLDEAFAGVDENNIRDMFDLMEQLGFNYIINSQSLWGDYDTVPALAIVELVRPKNAGYVTPIHYLWNGQVRELLTRGADIQLTGTAGR